jgi:FG-GAP-like repeat
LMNDATSVQQWSLTPSAVPPPWRVVGVDDFNGDRKSDILVQNATTGQVSLWYMDGLSRVGETAVQPATTPWRVATTADLDGDGDADMVWRHPATGQIYAWTIQGGLVVGGAALTPGTVDISWRLVSAFDINRDGRSDLVWQNDATGMLYVWYMNGLTSASGGGTTPVGTSLSWKLKAVADLNQDGHADFVWQHAVTGQLYVWRMNGVALASEGFLAPTQVNVAWEVVGGR